MNGAVASIAAVLVAGLALALTLTVRQLRRDRTRGRVELGASMSRLRAVADAITEAMVILDASGRVSLANRAAHRLFGATTGGLAGCHLEQLLPAYRLSAGSPGADGGDSAHAEVAAFRRDGSSFSAQVVSSPVTGGEGSIVVIREISQARAAAETLSPQSFHDSLTGLPNERQLRDQLDARLKAAATRRTPFSIFVLDLDRFAQVNERFGHPIGDRLLTYVAERLRQTLRASDIVARLGGDDFAILPGGSATPAACARIARQVVAAFKEPASIDGRVVQASVSIGIAHFPDHGEDVESLMGHAEVARQAAKRARRGWRVFTPADDDAEVEERAVRLSELRKALDNQELELFYQPMVRLAGSGLLALDATVRWRHHRHGLLAPGEFLPAAEQTDIIRALTRAILGLAVEQQARWREQGHGRLRVNIRIAGRNVQDRQLPRAVTSLLERWDVAASALSITVDENTALPAEAPVLHALAETGVGLALDGYGSGSASLLRLRGLPFAELRLEGSLVASAQGDGAEAAAVRGIVELAHALNLVVIATGVDDEATRASLQQLGCDAAQGRLWGEPVPAGAVIPLLRLLARQSRFPGLGRYRPGSTPPRTEPAETG